MKFSKAIATVASAAALFVAADAFAGTTYSYTMAKKSYSGSRDRQYKVYVPTGVSNPAPMVMVLHGCVQDHNDVLNQWGMKAKADEAGFILVTPFITTYDGMRNTNCWGFWFNQHTKQGQGEPEDLYQIGLEVEGQYSIDANKRYITGLSSGGAMTVIASVTHNEYWTAAAPAAGLAYGETSSSVAMNGQKPTFQGKSTTVSNMKAQLNSDYVIPLMVLQNNDDNVVMQPAGNNIRDAHLEVHGPAGFKSTNTTKASDAACASFWSNNYSCKHIKYTDDGTTTGKSLVETIFFNGPQGSMKGHYWVGGTDGNYAVATGPKYPDIIWEFFNRQSRGGSTPAAIGVPQITLAGDNPTLIPLGGTFTDPGATATDLEDGTLSVTTDCNVNVNVVGDYRCVYVAIDTAGNEADSVRVVKVFDTAPPTASCGTSTASPSAHITAGRAVKGGNFDLYAMAKNEGGGLVEIGNSFNTWTNVTLYEGNAGDWFVQEPAVCHGGDDDAIAPAVNVTAPANSATVSGTVSVTATASDAVGVTKVEFYINNVLQSTDTTSPYAYSWNTTAVSNGTYAIKALAYDASGNIGTDNDTSVTVNNQTTECWYATNAAHATAGRAEYKFVSMIGYSCFAKGQSTSAHVLNGAWGSCQSTVSTYVKKVGTIYEKATSCQ